MAQFIPTTECLVQDQHTIQLKTTVSKELLAFQGHFPEFAVFPGVAQIAIIKQIISQYFANLGPICRMEQVRFQNFILPDQEIFISIEQVEQTINFKISNAAQQAVASGRLFFNATV